MVTEERNDNLGWQVVSPEEFDAFPISLAEYRHRRNSDFHQSMCGLLEEGGVVFLSAKNSREMLRQLGVMMRQAERLNWELELQGSNTSVAIKRKEHPQPIDGQLPPHLVIDFIRPHPIANRLNDTE